MALAGSLKPDYVKLDYANTHRDIVEQCKRGSRKAQFELYRLYAKAMYNVCIRMVGNEQDAEDLLQGSFVDVYAHLETFRYQSTIGAWIKRIVVNNCINFLKRRRLEIEEFVPFQHDKEEEEEQDPPAGLTVDAVRQALFYLPDGYRVVFSLYAMEGYDHQEIADVLGITEATSKSQYSRARRKLKEILIEKRLINYF
ncbi:MAG: RNA polymerase sigma factor [Lewinellaceae bacterium]|nr:RNA polymerase sigma factor [Lewinella sp.]MCB9280307.1 RNA polymerase sigma factor [Lewinellaceae bacterium]